MCKKKKNRWKLPKNQGTFPAVAEEAEMSPTEHNQNAVQQQSTEEKDLENLDLSNADVQAHMHSRK